MQVGAIIISAKLDNTGFEFSVKKMEQGIKKLGENTAKNMQSVSAAVGGTSSAIMKQQALVDELRKKHEGVANKMREAAEKVAEIDKAQQSANDASRIAKENANAAFDAWFKQKEILDDMIMSQKYSSDEIGKQEQIVEALHLASARAHFEVRGYADKLAESNRMLEAARNTVESTNAEYSETGVALDEAKGKISSVNQELGKTQQTAEAISETVTEVNDATAEVNETAAKVGKTAPKAMKETGKAASKATKDVGGLGKSMAHTLKRIKNLLVATLVFNVLRSAFKGFRDYIERALKSNEALVKSFAQLKANAMTAFQPILDFIIPIIAKLVEWLNIAIQYIIQFIAALTGRTVKSMQDAAKAMGKLASNTANAGKAAKKALAPFDELNQLAQDTAEGAGAGIITPKFVDMPNTNLSFLDNSLAKIKEIVSLFMSGFWEGFASADFSKLRQAISGIGSTLKRIFTDPEVKNAFEKLILSWITNAGRFTGSILNIGTTIATGVIGGFNAFLDENKDDIKTHLIECFDISEEISNLVGSLAVDIADIFTMFAGENAQKMVGSLIGIFWQIYRIASGIALRIGRDTIGLIATPINENKKEIKIALNGLLGFFAETLGTIEGLLDHVGEKITELYDLHIKPFVDNVKKSFSEWVKHLSEGWNTHIQPVLDWIAAKFKDVAENHIKPAIDEVIKAIGKIIDLISWIWDNMLRPWVSWLIDFFMPIIAMVFKNAADGVLSAFAAIGDVISNLFASLSGLVDFIVGLINGDLTGALKGLGNFVIGILNTIVAVLNFVWDLILGVVNGLIDAANLLGKLVGFEIPRIPSQDLMIPNIPYLATGTVVPPNREFLAVLGDNKREHEIVSPLSTIEQAVENVLSRRSEGGGEINIIADGDVGELIRFFRFKMQEEDRRVGSRMSNRLVTT